MCVCGGAIKGGLQMRPRGGAGDGPEGVQDGEGALPERFSEGPL